MKMKEQKNWYDYTIGIGIFLIFAVVPLFISAKYVDVNEAEKVIRSGTTALDVFSYYKSIMICFVTLFMAAIFIMYVPEKGHKKYYFNHPIFFCGGAFVLFVIISFIFTPFKDVALIGISERFESMWVLISYMALMIITFSYCNTIFRVKFITLGIFSGIAVIGIIGMFQYFDMDIFSTEFGAKWVLGDMYNGTGLNIKFDEVYSLLYNPNCVGMYCSLVLPFTTILAVSLPFNIFKHKFAAIVKYISIIFSIILLINLIGSDSDGAFIAVFLSLFIAFILAFIYIIKNKKYKKCSKAFTAITSAIVVAIVLVSTTVVFKSEVIQTKIFNNIDILTGKTQGSTGYYITDFSIDYDKNRVEILTLDDTIFIDYDKEKNMFQISNSDGILLPYENGDFSLETVKLKEENKQNAIPLKNINGADLIARVFLRNNIPFLNIKYEKTNIYFRVSNEGIISAVNKYYEITDINKKAESIGFKGSESFGTGRGYIWSRSLPLVLSNGIKGFIAGSGPDSFAIAFPQFELREKLNYLGNPYIIVDKPHNMYLQTAINTGLLSLVTLIILFVVYIYKTIRSILEDSNNDRFVFSFKFAVLIGIIGYLISALTTDSVVSVAPTFWIMLGAGFAVSEFFKEKKH